MKDRNNLKYKILSSAVAHTSVDYFTDIRAYGAEKSQVSYA